MTRKKRKKGFRLTHLIIILIIFCIGRTLINQTIMMKELNERKSQELEEIEKLQNEIEQLQSEIENKDSLEFVEKVARDELRLVRPREIIYIDKNKEKNSFINPLR